MGDEARLAVEHYGLEHPSHYMSVSYTVTPELPDSVLTIVDCDDGDRHRQAPSAPGQPVATACSMVMGIIGVADSPTTTILYGPNKQDKLLAACSSLHFEPVEQVEWRLVFHEKQLRIRSLIYFRNASPIPGNFIL